MWWKTRGLEWTFFWIFFRMIAYGRKFYEYKEPKLQENKCKGKQWVIAILLKRTMLEFFVVIEQVSSAANCRDWRSYLLSLMELGLLTSVLIFKFLLKLKWYKKPNTSVLNNMEHLCCDCAVFCTVFFFLLPRLSRDGQALARKNCFG